MDLMWSVTSQAENTKRLDTVFVVPPKWLSLIRSRVRCWAGNAHPNAMAHASVSLSLKRGQNKRMADGTWMAHVSYHAQFIWENVVRAKVLANLSISL